MLSARIGQIAPQFFSSSAERLGHGAVRQQVEGRYAMSATWLRDLLNKGRHQEQQDLPLTDFWITQLLQSGSACVYEVSRDEPFRLRHVRASDTPVTPALLNRTVTTIVGIMEPDQPRLAREFCDALRTVAPDTPTELRYRSAYHGVIRVATIVDLGPEHDRLYVLCREK
jgi:hypothetical protein